MIKYVVTFVLLSTAAIAQPIVPSEYVIKLAPAEIDIISDGLQTQPFGKVAPLMNKLRAQVLEQQQPKQEDKKDNAAPPTK